MLKVRRSSLGIEIFCPYYISGKRAESSPHQRSMVVYLLTPTKARCPEHDSIQRSHFDRADFLTGGVYNVSENFGRAKVEGAVVAACCGLIRANQSHHTRNHSEKQVNLLHSRLCGVQQ